MSNSNPPKIGDVEVRNYMRVRRARLTLDGNTFVISGDNEQGKSSFVQAIEDAFGGSKFSPAMPIRKGATEATILITLTDGSGRVLKAEVVHSKTGRRLVVKDADGKPQTSPQSIMDAFWAETSFDPSLFLISKADKQVEMLKRLAGLDFTALEKEHGEKFAFRTNLGREVDRLAAIASGKPEFPNAPKQEVLGREVLERIGRATEFNSARNQRRQKLTAIKMQADATQRRAQGLAQDIEDTEKRLAKLRADFEAIRKEATDIDHERITAEADLASAEDIDLAPLKQELAAVDETNRQVRANAEKAKATEDARAKRGEYDKLTRRLDEIAETKTEMLRGAKFPIAGMSIDGDDVTIDGIPLAQQSDSRRLAIGVEMAAVMNPGKPLMLVRHGNLFTPQNFHILEEIAAKRNLTCIVEIPGRDVKGAKLVFEDGVGTVPSEAAPEQTELAAT
jgi:hypothetical protein